MNMSHLDKEMLLGQIKGKGYQLSSLDDLMHINKSHKDLLPILLMHLDSVADESDKQFLVRCLGVKGFDAASKPLIREFYHAQNSSYKWAIGNSLALIADGSVFPDLLKITQDKSHGTARQMIVDSLWHYPCDETKAVLVSLLSDNDVAGHAIRAISKLQDPKLLEYVEPLQKHEVAWIRNAAKSATKKLKSMSHPSQNIGES